MKTNFIPQFHREPMMQDVTEPDETVKNTLNQLAIPNDQSQVEKTPLPAEAEIEEKKPDQKKPDFVTADYIDATTETAIALLDNVQETCFTIFANYKKKSRALKILPETGVSRLNELKAEKMANSGGNVEVIKNHEGADAKLLHLDAVVEEYLKGLPFTERQIKSMKPGLRVMVERNAGKIPPELLFFAGLATAIGGNIAEYHSF